MANRTDNFNRADSTTTINPPSDGGSDWVVGSTSVWGIETNRGRTVTLGAGGWATLWFTDVGTKDMEAQFTASGTVPTGLGAVCRLSGHGDFLMGYCTSTSRMDIYKKTTAGGFVSLSNTTGLTLADGDTFLFRADSADLLSFYQNGNLRTSVTDTTLATEVNGGMYNDSTGRRFDAFSLTALASSTRPVKMAGYWGGYAGISGGFAG